MGMMGSNGETAIFVGWQDRDVNAGARAMTGRVPQLLSTRHVGETDTHRTIRLGRFSAEA